MTFASEMTIVSEILSNLSDQTGLTKGEIANVIVAGVGAVATFAAAFSASRAARATRTAARATRDSVREMRESRLQAVRPHLRIHYPDDTFVFLSWEIGKLPKYYHRYLGEYSYFTEPPAIKIQNVGLGAAVNIRVEWDYGPTNEYTSSTPSKAGLLKLQKFFERGGFQVEKLSDLAISVFSPRKPGGDERDFILGRRLIMLGERGEERSPTHQLISNCYSKGLSHIKMSEFSFFSCIGEQILAELEGNPGFTSQRIDDLITIHYESVTGESFAEKRRSRIRISSVHVRNERDQRVPMTGRWTTLVTSFSFD